MSGRGVVEFRTDKKGRPLKDDEGNELPPLWRPRKLHASDIVDTGDAVDGLLAVQKGLSIEGLPDAVVRQAAVLLDRQFGDAADEVIRTRCLAWLNRHLDQRRGGTGPVDPVAIRIAANARQGRLGRLDPDTLRFKALARQQRLQPALHPAPASRPGLLPYELRGLALPFYSRAFVHDKDGEEFIEVIDPRCFNETRNTGRNIRALIEHNGNQEVGSTTAGNLRLMINPPWQDSAYGGLHYRRDRSTRQPGGSLSHQAFYTPGASRLT